MSFRAIRTGILLLILLFVGLDAVLTHLRTTDWDRPLWVTVFPVNGDGSDDTRRYIGSLSERDFLAIEAFMTREARRYGVVGQPVRVVLRPEVHALPPAPPASGNPFLIMWWSLKLRFWAWQHADNNEGRPVDVRMFVVYYDPSNVQTIKHSLGLKKGLIGVVNVFSGRKMGAENNVVIAHELLHTVGATDKYDLSNNQPLYPHGYADPERNPLYPQARAEIMAGRIPVSESEARQAGSLGKEMVGPLTAHEINWRK